MRQGRAHEGITFARRALELQRQIDIDHPAVPEHLYTLAIAQRAAGQPDEALASLEEACARTDDHVLVGHVVRLMGEVHAQKRGSNRATRSRPGCTRDARDAR